MADTRLEPVVLSQDERRTLENWVRRQRTAQGLARRARIVLACADGGNNVAVAARLCIDRKTVARWRARFLRERLDGLADDPRPGVPERRSFDYERHGTTDLFAALDTATGKVISKLSAQHRAVDFLDQIDRAVEPGLEIHVICDNLWNRSSG